MWDIKEYRVASDPAEAVEMIHRGPGKGIFIAGGTDLFLYPPKCDYVVDISRAGLGGVARTPGGDLFIGSAATLEYLVRDELVAGFAGGAVSRVAALCGNRPVRSTATIGGNICNALPSADMAPVLLALDADCFIMGEDEQESLPLSEFFMGPRLTVLEGRLLIGVALPAEAAGRRCLSRKLTRSAEDIALVQVSVGLDIEDEVVTSARIALGAVAPVPMRSNLAETVLMDRPVAELTADVITDAAEIAAGEAEPISDHRASAEYRRAMVKVLTSRLITEALTGGQS
jgi:carbon-monoxide dehydrogenase medium subunit